MMKGTGDRTKAVFLWNVGVENVRTSSDSMLVNAGFGIIQVVSNGSGALGSIRYPRILQPGAASDSEL